MSGWRTFYRVGRPFRFGTRSFTKGEVIPANDPVVEALSHRPDLLHIRCTRIDLGSRRPQAMAGVRSLDEPPPPKRDWLAPSWRIP